MANEYHTPVMAAEVLRELNPQPGQTIVDATLGGGGHSALIAEQVGRSGTVVGFDQDPDAIAAAGKRFAEMESGARIVLIQARFDHLAEQLGQAGLLPIDGILFDLGVSSHQLDEPERGFSFKDPAMPLDMRMNAQSGDIPTAADLLNDLPEQELTRILRDYADERWAARIAQFVGKRRDERPFETVGDLIDTIKAAVPASARDRSGIHPATRAFQALRIAVNDEFIVLQSGLDQAVQALRSGSDARIVVISYHSGEDRIVKRTLQRLSGRCECPPEQAECICGATNPVLEILLRKPLGPTEAEIADNPRARSAKVRSARRI